MKVWVGAVVVVVVVVTGVRAAPQELREDRALLHHQREAEENEKQYPPRPYNFGFAIADHVEGVRFSQEAQSDEKGHVTGVYSYVRPDNVLVTVRYHADETGFHPTVVEEKAPQLPVHTSPVDAIASHTVQLPYVPEFRVRVTAQDLQQYKEMAARREQLNQRQKRQEGQE